MTEKFAFREDAPKKATNVSINRDLLAAARALKVNLSQTLERSLVEIIRAKQREIWRRDNKDAVAAFNRRIETAGAFSDGLRRF
jgi:antitoxin CcdA